MNTEQKRWNKRRKRPVRRVANDLRLAAPIISIALCFAGSATAIFATEHAPLPLIQEVSIEDAGSSENQDACPSPAESGTEQSVAPKGGR